MPAKCLFSVFFAKFARAITIHYCIMNRFSRIFSLCIAVLISLSALADNRKQVKLTTDYGIIVVELYNETPLHRDNFLRQVEAHTYDGVLFHRVINNFMIQTGDPTSKTAQPGQMLGNGDENDKESAWIPAEFCTPQLFHERGALAAAREGDSVNPEKKSSSQQFYIVTGRTYGDKGLEKAQETITEWTGGRVVLTEEMQEAYRTNGGAPHLDGSYTVFGRVLEGMDIVDKIQVEEADSNNRPLNDIHIIKAEIITTEN